MKKEKEQKEVVGENKMINEIKINELTAAAQALRETVKSARKDIELESQIEFHEFKKNVLNCLRKFYKNSDALDSINNKLYRVMEGGRDEGGCQSLRTIDTIDLDNLNSRDQSTLRTISDFNRAIDILIDCGFCRERV